MPPRTLSPRTTSRWTGRRLTADEIHTACDSATGQNLSLDDEKLRAAQLGKCLCGGPPPGKPNQQVIKIGDTVAVVSKEDKHKAWDVLIVTML